MTRKILSLALALLLALACAGAETAGTAGTAETAPEPAGLARYDAFYPVAATVGDVSISSAELERSVRRALLIGALSAAPHGRAYDVKDHLNILDEMSKQLFDLEVREVIRQEAGKRGLFLSMAESEECIARAAQQYQAYREIAAQYGAYLPASSFDAGAEDVVAAYFESWGLTEESLYREAYGAKLDELLKQSVAGDIADEDEQINVYSDWVLARMDEVLKEEPLAAVEVALRLTE